MKDEGGNATPILCGRRPPDAIAPGLHPGSAPCGRFLRRRIVAGAAPAGGSGKCAPRPSTPPAQSAVADDRLIGIGRAGRQVAALAADQAREAELVGADQRMRARRGGRRARSRRGRSLPASRAIWPSASTTASKVSKRRGVARLVVAHRLEHREIGPFARRAAGRRPSASRAIVSRSAISSSGVAPTMWRAISDDEA